VGSIGASRALDSEQERTCPMAAAIEWTGDVEPGFRQLVSATDDLSEVYKLGTTTRELFRRAGCRTVGDAQRLWREAGSEEHVAERLQQAAVTWRTEQPNRPESWWRSVVTRAKTCARRIHRCESVHLADSDRLQELLLCNLCGEHFLDTVQAGQAADVQENGRQPIVLRSGHSICRTCYNRHAANAGAMDPYSPNQWTPTLQTSPFPTSWSLTVRSSMSLLPIMRPVGFAPSRQPHREPTSAACDVHVGGFSGRGAVSLPEITSISSFFSTDGSRIVNFWWDCDA